MSTERREGTFRTKLFIRLKQDADYFLEEARKQRLQLEKEGLLQSDDKRKAIEWRLARASFITRMIYLEALTNAILNEFKIKERNIKSLPPHLTKQLTAKKKRFRINPIEDKLLLIPYLCVKDVDFNKKYFDRESSLFKRLMELKKIRNTLAHSTIESYAVEIDFEAGSYTDDFPDNFWPETEIHKDLSVFSYEDASKTKAVVEEIVKLLESFLGIPLMSGNWATEETIELKTGGNKTASIKKLTARRFMHELP